MQKDFISVLDAQGEIEGLLELAIKLKSVQRSGEGYRPLKDKVLGMIFEKPSLRTRVSFEVGFGQLGGTALYLSPSEIQVGKRESVYDVAKVISRYVDIIMYRAFDNRVMRELAKHADVPVINALDDIEHPCQIMADLMTVLEQKGALKGLKLAYVGDGNNVCNSLLLGCPSTGMDISVACPRGYEPDQGVLERARGVATENGCKVEFTSDPKVAVKGADVIYTDTWVSMGDEAEAAKRLEAFKGFQVNEALVSGAKPDYIFLHCLPAHRGQEVTDEVIDSPNSVVFDEAENRMHAQKAIMVALLGAESPR